MVASQTIGAFGEKTEVGTMIPIGYDISGRPGALFARGAPELQPLSRSGRVTRMKSHLLDRDGLLRADDRACFALCAIARA